MGTFGTSKAVCDSGDIALGGSYEIFSSTTNIDFLIYFDGNVGTNTYRTQIQNFDSQFGSISFQSNVFCFDNPTLR